MVDAVMIGIFVFDQKLQIAVRLVKWFFVILTNIYFHLLTNILLGVGMLCGCVGTYPCRRVGYRCL